MLRRILSTILAIACGSLAIVPAYAHDDGVATLSGTFWIDENLDGIRQLDEPAAPGATANVDNMGSFGRWRDPFHAIRANDQGEFNYPWRIIRPPPTWKYVIYEFYSKPGVEPVTHNGRTYTHFGCAHFFAPPGITKVTVNIRLLPARQYELRAMDWPISDGHFFGQAVDESYRGCDEGFAVTNADGIAFWDTWQRLGLENIGYPVSHRYKWRGFVTQVFQKAIMQWQPGKGVFFVNVFDELHDAGGDHWLDTFFAIPPQVSSSFDGALPEHLQGELRERYLKQIKDAQLALLDANPAIKESYFAAPDPLRQYGLPTSRVEDMGNHYAIRTQKTVFQQWKEDVPWAKAGEVTTANGGDIAKRFHWHTYHFNEEGRVVYRSNYLFFAALEGLYQPPVPTFPQHSSLVHCDQSTNRPAWWGRECPRSG